MTLGSAFDDNLKDLTGAGAKSEARAPSLRGEWADKAGSPFASGSRENFDIHQHEIALGQGQLERGQVSHQVNDGRAGIDAMRDEAKRKADQQMSDRMLLFLLEQELAYINWSLDVTDKAIEFLRNGGTYEVGSDGELVDKDVEKILKDIEKRTGQKIDRNDSDAILQAMEKHREDLKHDKQNVEQKLEEVNDRIDAQTPSAQTVEEQNAAIGESVRIEREDATREAMKDAENVEEVESQTTKLTFEQLQDLKGTPEHIAKLDEYVSRLDEKTRENICNDTGSDSDLRERVLVHNFYEYYRELRMELGASPDFPDILKSVVNDQSDATKIALRNDANLPSDIEQLLEETVRQDDSKSYARTLDGQSGLQTASLNMEFSRASHKIESETPGRPDYNHQFNANLS